VLADGAGGGAAAEADDEGATGRGVEQGGQVADQVVEADGGGLVAGVERAV
jgi:hypothetical protein